MTTPDVPVPARDELVALAAVTRPDWETAAVHAVLTDAGQKGMNWGQVLAAMGRLMADPDANPRELVPDHWSPLARRPRPPDEVRARGIARVRAALTQREREKDHD